MVKAKGPGWSDKPKVKGDVKILKIGKIELS